MKVAAFALVFVLCIAYSMAIKCHVCTGDDDCKNEKDCGSGFDACIKIFGGEAPSISASIDMKLR